MKLSYIDAQGRKYYLLDIIDYVYDERFKRLFFVTKFITGSVTNVTNVTVVEE
ncbi:MAG: hypothetical protein MJ237_08650 [bacterium]|nr:hypothetical protein [bacterium]